MKRWDLFLVAAIVLSTLAAAGVDLRAGAFLLAGELAAVWYWLGDIEEG